jgi:carbon-monoxide dehydrogenase large subunit
MTDPYFGRPLKRSEDPWLLTGQALFVDDVHLPGMLHAAFVRSPHAHARIRSVDAAQALQIPGVVVVYSAADLGEILKPGPLLVSPPPIPGLIFHRRTHTPLAVDKVRYAGEPVALVIAESRYLAEDGAAAVNVDYEVLEPVLDMEKALEPGSPLVHEDLIVDGCGTNLAAHVIQKRGNYAAILTAAHTRIARRFHYDRGTAAPIEPRGIVAAWDPLGRRLTVWDTTQSPIPIRNGLATLLGLSENQVHVIAPFIGGGFGSKLLTFYPEESLIPWVSVRLQRPIKWIEDRLENFTATTHERAQIHDAEIALDAEGHILGVRDSFIHDTGAYDPYGLTVPINSQCTLLGAYNIPNYESEFRVAFTNKTIVTPYRGAGRQHGVFVIERLLDLGARELNLDPAEIRRRNFLPQGAFPHDNNIIYQDFAPLVYDSGNYEPILKRAQELIGYDEFIQVEQPRLRAQGRHVGIGLVAYVEGTGIGPYEGARVQVLSNGKVSVVTGVGTQGQGHFTSFAQIAADQLGVDVRDVEVITGDTDQFHWGTGTFASRGAVVAGSAVYQAACQVRQKIMHLAADVLESPPEDLDLADGRVSLREHPDRGLTLSELAARANPLRGAVRPGTEPGLEATRYFGPDRGTTACGMHAMIVEVDPVTLELKIQKYVVVHDCGKVINPLILEGQVQGGVAQGIGNAFYEQLVYDPAGHLVNANLRDYLLPTALEIPRILTGHLETSSPLNPMGVKGAGEAGAIPVGALFAQALENALYDRDFVILSIPLQPSRLWELTQETPARDAGVDTSQ